MIILTRIHYWRMGQRAIPIRREDQGAAGLPKERERTRAESRDSENQGPGSKDERQAGVPASLAPGR